MLDMLLLSLGTAFETWDELPLADRLRLCCAWLDEHDAREDILQSDDRWAELEESLGSGDLTASGACVAHMVQDAALEAVKERWNEWKRQHEEEVHGRDD